MVRGNKELYLELCFTYGEHFHDQWVDGKSYFEILESDEWDAATKHISEKSGYLIRDAEYDLTLYLRTRMTFGGSGKEPPRFV